MQTINPGQQPHDRLYAMKMNFVLDIGLTEVNDIAAACGMPEKIFIQNGKAYSVTQTLPFIPDETMIKDYEKTIKEGYNKNNTRFSCESCRFTGYEYLYMVEPETERTKGQ